MQKKTLQTLEYNSVFWIWILLFEPALMRTANDVVQNKHASLILAVVTAAAIVIETMVWRSKIAHMKAAHTFPESSPLVMVVWIGHMVGSMILFLVCISALGIYNPSSQDFTPLSLFILFGMFALVAKEIFFLLQLINDKPKAPKYSLNVSNGGLLFATMIMHSCFWGLATANGALLHTYGFWEMLLVEAPAAGLLFLISYIPSRILPFLEEYTQSRAARSDRWMFIGYTLVTMLFALRTIY